MTLTPEQLSEVRRRMEEEHRKDREALERLMRFVHTGSSAQGAAPREEDSSDVEDSPVPTIIGKVEAIITADPNRKWTVPAMLAHLRHENFPLKSHKPEATLGQVFVRLQRRGVIKVVRRGSGRIPNVFKAAVKEVGDQDGTKSERATQGQPVAVH